MDNNTMIRVSDVTMRFRMNNNKILSLKEFVTTRQAAVQHVHRAGARLV